jgi:hypothetical protein
MHFQSYYFERANYNNGFKIYNDAQYSWQADFEIEGIEYSLIAEDMEGAGVYQLHMMEIQSRRVPSDVDQKVIKSFVEASKIWVEQRQPKNFYVLTSSSKPVYKQFADKLKESLKDYIISIDETIDEKDEEGNIIREGNPVGKIIFARKKKELKEPNEEKIELEPFEKPQDATIVKFKIEDKLDKI